MKNLKYYLTILISFISLFLFAQNSLQLPKEILENFYRNAVKTPSTVDMKGLHVKTAKSSQQNVRLIQNALDNNNIVFLPNEPILISSEGISLNSNNILIFGDKTVLILEPNELKSYQILRIKNVKNVKIINPKIVGDRYEHKGKNGEWGMGISITGSDNVEIFNANITKTWGDGLYIGKSKLTSSNISIFNIKIDEARRNGISITCGKNILIKNAIISRTDGTNPKAGIDIEPNNNNDIIENISLVHINTYMNRSHGIIASLSGLIGKDKKNVSVTIDSHTDYGSKAGFAIGTTGKRSAKNGNAVGGFVKIIRAKYINNYYKGIELYKSLYTNLDLIITEPIIMKNNQIDYESIKEYKSKINEFYQR